MVSCRAQGYRDAMQAINEAGAKSRDDIMHAAFSVGGSGTERCMESFMDGVHAAVMDAVAARQRSKKRRR